MLTDLVREGETIYETKSISERINPPSNHTDKLYSAFRGPSCNDMHFGVVKLGNKFFRDGYIPMYNINEPLSLYHGKRCCISSSSFCDNDERRSLARNFLREKLLRS